MFNAFLIIQFYIWVQGPYSQHFILQNKLEFLLLASLFPAKWQSSLFGPFVSYEENLKSFLNFNLNVIS
jgi:hypothetical protein